VSTKNALSFSQDSTTGPYSDTFSSIRTLTPYFFKVGFNTPTIIHPYLDLSSYLFRLSDENHLALPLKQEILERTNPLNFLTVFNNAASVAMFSYCKLRTSVSKVTLTTMITLIEQ
jgi:hypothetical protein